MSNVTLKFLGIFFANGCQGHSGLTKELSTPREKTQTPEGLSAKTRWHFTRGVCANGWFGAPYASYRCVATEETASAGREDHLAVAPFTNSARKDNLQLYHWVRVVNGIPPTGDYSFVKCNKSVDIVKYTDEEYEKYLTDPVWTKEETAQLFELCQRFDLRFIVIADGFPSSRTVEELKDRYYSVARARLSARAPSPGDISGHPLVKEPYNVSQETERKRALSMVLSQTKQQERKDTEV